MGLGRFGGGVGVARWLAGQGADVLVTDLEPAARLADSLSKIDDLVRSGAISLRLGEHNVSDFTDTDLVVANPAVPKPWDNRFLRSATAAGVPITTEIRLLVERLPDRKRVIGVTGTVGKSTTAAMMAHVLRETGRTVWFGGNIGGSLLAELPRVARDSWVVLELSSAMLHWLSADAGYPGAPGWSPGVAVITNLSPNHLDWHGEFDHYSRSKQQIVRDEQPGDTLIVDEALSSWAADARCASVPSSDHPITPSPHHHFIPRVGADSIPPLPVPGRHNRLNAAFALAAVQCVGIDPAAALRALATFRGLPDRLEYLGEFTLPEAASDESRFRGARKTRMIRAYNDSKSTTPESARLAVDAMDDDPAIGAGRVRLICGGYDKKIDLSPLAQAAARCALAYTIGQTGPALAEAINRAGGRAVSCGGLHRAVAGALADAKAGDVILLSPGCASWDQFTNYEERGRRFRELLERTTEDSTARPPLE